MPLELIFLGTSPLAIPLFFCQCVTCESARKNPQERRTRASIAIIGKELTIIDPGPDLEHQLEREQIRQPICNILITHWHYDHIAGLGTLREVNHLAKWESIKVYVPEQVIFHFDQELAYLKPALNIHKIKVGDIINLQDFSVEVVKTEHIDHSIGFILSNIKRIAYLVDTTYPSEETRSKLKNLDIIIMEATVDELVAPIPWQNFSLEQALDFWEELKPFNKECIFTHLSNHRWINGELLSGLTRTERKTIESENPGLTFAYDGLKVLF